MFLIVPYLAAKTLNSKCFQSLLSSNQCFKTLSAYLQYKEIKILNFYEEIEKNSSSRARKFATLFGFTMFYKNLPTGDTASEQTES